MNTKPEQEANKNDADTPKSGKQDKRPRRTLLSASANSQGDKKKTKDLSLNEITEDGSNTH